MSRNKKEFIVNDTNIKKSKEYVYLEPIIKLKKITQISKNTEKGYIFKNNKLPLKRKVSDLCLQLVLKYRKETTTLTKKNSEKLRTT